MSMLSIQNVETARVMHPTLLSSLLLSLPCLASPPPPAVDYNITVDLRGNDGHRGNGREVVGHDTDLGQVHHAVDRWVMTGSVI